MPQQAAKYQDHLLLFATGSMKSEGEVSSEDHGDEDDLWDCRAAMELNVAVLEAETDSSVISHRKRF